VNEAHITGGAGGTDRVGGTGDAEIEGDFTGRVVGNRARVVIVRPILRIVVKLRDGVDFVLRLDVAVLGGADVDADAVLREIGEVEIEPARVPTRSSFLVWYFSAS